MNQERKSAILRGIQQHVTQGKYLGLPMVITRTKEQVFGYIRDSKRSRLSNWKNKMLSATGREIMLKAVTMAMPTFAMSCFKLTAKLCKDIMGPKANF